MSKVSFRARQIDFNKPLPILRNAADLLSEFNENALVNRGVPQIPSGMEKEEENEHHFMEVINAIQSGSDADIKIPVPDIIDRTESYKMLYPDDFCLSKQLVHIRTILLSEKEVAEYDMDSEDEEWLSKSDLGISPEKFEYMIDRLERGCGQKVMNLEEARCLLQDDPHLVIAVYDYWLNKRVQSQQPLHYSVRQEKRDGGSNADPYVAFRRRSEKMQTRKNRKNDEQSYEKMLILRHHMSKLGEILSRLVDRESIKEALLQTDYQLFESRYYLSDWDGNYLRDAETIASKMQGLPNSTHDISPSKEPNRKRPCHKRKTNRRDDIVSLSSVNSTEHLAEYKPSDNPFVFVRTPGCRYLKPRGILTEDKQSQGTPPSHPFRYSYTTVPSVRHGVYCGYIRRRLGRGGRIIYDRKRLPHGFPEASTNADGPSVPSDFGACPLTQSEAKDDALLRRLTAVVLSSHRGRPIFRWPVPVNNSSSLPSFVSLQPHLTQVCSDTLHPRRQSMIPSVKSECTTSKSVSAITSDVSPVNSFDRIQAHNSPVFDAAQSTERKVVPLSLQPSDAIGSPGLQQSFTDVETLSAAPFRIWRKLSRPYYALDALQPSDFAKSRGTEVQIDAPNGVGPRLHKSSDNDLLMKNPSLLHPPKMRCLTRDCVTRDVHVPVRQMQTANGVNASPFFQLPT